MMNIAFMNSGVSYLPEIKAYINYFEKLDGYNALEIIVGNEEEVDETIDVIWKFMGTDLFKTKNRHNQLIIHEYNSLSTGRFGKLKNVMKKHLNKTPDGRIFLNKVIENTMNFPSDVPSITRDMGIDDSFFGVNQPKDYDYVYLGSLDTSRQVNRLLHTFKTVNKSQNILLIGTVPDDLYKEFRGIDNIIFSGKVDYLSVPTLASSAEYGINYIPNIYPYNVQTSTKLLEYCAIGLKIITTNYEWATAFEKAREGSFFKLNDDLSNLRKEYVEDYSYITPQVADLKWNTILGRIGIENFLHEVSNRHLLMSRRHTH